MDKIPPLYGLRAFEAAARNLSFKLAAEELFVTPAAISNQIHRLEESLGVKLFTRLNRRVELTDAGAKYLIRMKMIFDDIREATRDVVQRGDSPVITLAVPPTLLQSWLIPVLPSIYKSLPDTNLRIIDTLRYVDFEKESVDAAIRYGFGGWEGVNSNYLFSEDICPICSPELLTSKQLTCPQELENFRLIYTERRLVQWDNYLAAGGYDHVDVKEKLWLLNSAHTLEATIKGLGVALINRNFIADHLASGALVIPFEWDIQLPRKTAYYFVTEQGSQEKNEVSILRNTILSLAK